METICRVCLCWYGMSSLIRRFRCRFYECRQCYHAKESNRSDPRHWVRLILTRVAEFDEIDTSWEEMSQPDGFPVGVTDTNTQYHVYRRRLLQSELAERLEYEQRHDPNCQLAPFRRPLPNIPLSD